jgi:hypothetical protein
MKNKYDALLKNSTWKLVPALTHANIIDSKWVYKIKERVDVTIEWFTTRLVGQRFTQKHGIDYTETFSLVIKPITI